LNLLFHLTLCYHILSSFTLYWGFWHGVIRAWIAFIMPFSYRRSVAHFSQSMKVSVDKLVDLDLWMCSVKWDIAPIIGLKSGSTTVWHLHVSFQPLICYTTYKCKLVLSKSLWCVVLFCICCCHHLCLFVCLLVCDFIF